MAAGDFEDQDGPRRQYAGPHSGRHPIPTVQSYRKHQRQFQSQEEETENAHLGAEDRSKPKRAIDSVKALVRGVDVPKNHHDPYPATNHNYSSSSTHSKEEKHEVDASGPQRPDAKGGEGRTAAEEAAGLIDPKAKRKAMKKNKNRGGGREVTDPVTHLPITIHDQTETDLASVPEQDSDRGSTPSAGSGPGRSCKPEMGITQATEKLQRGYNGMQKVFPPPNFDDLRRELATVYQRSLFTGLAALVSAFVAIELLQTYLGGAVHPKFSSMASGSVFVGLASGVVVGLSCWLKKKVTEIFDDEVWHAARHERVAVESDAELPESVQWLNSFFSAVWPLINPDLFSSLVDTIEDVMQASLPKLVKMVAVDDMGQGSESFRILGVRWLPTGAASKTVGSDTQVDQGDRGSSEGTDARKEKEEDARHGLARAEGITDSKNLAQDDGAVQEGMEGEDGDFVNLEFALAYRSRSSGKSIKEKAKKAHLYLKFYLPGGIAVPVWVELRGFIATLRVRLQLTPDPPFVALCTLTFLGQPKASMSCVPLSKHSPNLMDLPLVSSFVQSAIDAALAEYVAPKSLTMNLKDMLMGADFKTDTNSLGVIWIIIKRASGFKPGDCGIVFSPRSSSGSSDAYVTVSWAKFGRPVASTRIIEHIDEPAWHEYASILVTPEEVNAEEGLRLQLWDSDKLTADDDLGRLTVDLKSIMHNPECHNRRLDRVDSFTGQDPGEAMPGTLEWSVSYFPKTRITRQQIEQQKVHRHIATKDELKEHISGLAERKLREAGKAPDDEEVRQQKSQDYKEMEDSMICSTPPSRHLPSGILSIQIHNITGLQVQNLRKRRRDEEVDGEDEEDEADDLPDSYCTIILNQRKIYRTRTKPKSSKPFFNAGTERFIRDWTCTEVIISVRDAVEREDDPLIGIIYLPLSTVFAEKSQVMDNYRLIGGIGYGKVRMSMLFRSVDAQLPPNLMGWDVGTLEIRGCVNGKGDLPDKITHERLKLHTNLGRCKMYPDQGKWVLKHREKSDSAFLAVRKRYASALVIEFRRTKLGPDTSPAFAVLWLHELVDEQQEVKTLKVWKGGKHNLRRAMTCCNYRGMQENEEAIGEIDVTVKFWRGLSGFHKSYAARLKKPDLRNVMECLDTITDEKLGDDEEESDDDSDSSEDENEEGDARARRKLKVHTNDDSSASSSDQETDGRTRPTMKLSNLKKAKKILRSPIDGVIDTAASVLSPGHTDSTTRSSGLRNSLRDYKDHHKQLHRQHRGIMQWRPMREIDHFGGKLGRLKGHVGDMFSHDEKEVGVETEV